MVSNQFFKIKRSWRFEERCPDAVYAPDCKKDLDVYETFILNVTIILRERRRARAQELYITGDLNVELGLFSTDEDDIGEFHEMYGPLCWQWCERDHGGFKKLTWYGIMKGSIERPPPRGPIAAGRKK